jgi:hypothetical protein
MENENLDPCPYQIQIAMGALEKAYGLTIVDISPK